MPPRYKCKIFINLILFILVIQLNHLVNIYEMARIDFNVPMIEHLQKTPIEAQVKIIYRETTRGEIHRFEYANSNYSVSGCSFVNPTMFQ